MRPKAIQRINLHFRSLISSHNIDVSSLSSLSASLSMPSPPPQLHSSLSSSPSSPSPSSQLHDAKQRYRHPTRGTWSEGPEKVEESKQSIDLNESRDRSTSSRLLPRPPSRWMRESMVRFHGLSPMTPLSILLSTSTDSQMERMPRLLPSPPSHSIDRRSMSSSSSAIPSLINSSLASSTQSSTSTASSSSSTMSQSTPILPSHPHSASSSPHSHSRSNSRLLFHPIQSSSSRSRARHHLRESESASMSELRSCEKKNPLDYDSAIKVST